MKTKIFQNHLDMSWPTGSRWTCLSKGHRTRWPREVPSNLKHCVVLWTKLTSITLMEKSEINERRQASMIPIFPDTFWRCFKRDLIVLISEGDGRCQKASSQLSSPFPFCSCCILIFWEISSSSPLLSLDNLNGS